MPFQTERRMEFRDTDAAGIVHFSAFFPMMEAAEHQLLRSLGLSVMPRADEQVETPELAGVTWPRVAASCNYQAAAHFEDLLQIEVEVARIGTSSVRYRFRFSREGQPIAEGEMTSVCCRLHQHSGAPRLEKIEIPPLVRERLQSI